MEKNIRMKELVNILNEASKAYYQNDTEIMSNLEYDKRYDELCELEKETGIVLANSPTIHVGYEILSELEKQPHKAPMLSLDKTKDTDVLASFLGNHDGVLSWKLDGLTVVLTYEEGELKNAVTRGNGEIGEVITNNAKTFVNVPKRIPYKGELIVRGEAVIKYSDFNRMNASIEQVEERYKNPRNLCSGSVRQLNNEITAKRHVHFYAFSLVGDVESVFGTEDYKNTVTDRFLWLKTQGFDVVEHFVVSKDTVKDKVMEFANRIPDNDIPSDGLVLSYDDVEYGRSLGRTAKFPKDSIAFKWADEQAQTTLLEVEWSPSRTGLINPVAIFEPVELEGTTVTRASLHNVSIVRALGLGVGDRITVYKANMIIPQVADNFTRSGTLPIPSCCPACGKATVLKEQNGVQSLYCDNPQCSAKIIKGFSHFVSRNAFNIEGLSDATLEKFIDMGFLKELPDIFELAPYKEQIVEMEGFGVKSYDNLMESIKKAQTITMPKFIYSLGISGIGLANAKVLVSYFDWDFNKIRTAGMEELVTIEGIGEVLASAIVEFFSDEKKSGMIDKLLSYITFLREETISETPISGKTFVITGSVSQFANRNELKDYIEKMGGKVTGSVSKNTDYLINNDVTSNSSKNIKARELQIPILSEDDFMKLCQ